MIAIDDKLLLAAVGVFLLTLQFFFYFITKSSNKEVLEKIDELVKCVLHQNEKLVNEIQSKRNSYGPSVDKIKTDGHDILTKVNLIEEQMRSTSSILLEASLAWKSNLMAIEAIAAGLKEHTADCKDRNRDILLKLNT